MNNALVGAAAPGDHAVVRTSIMIRALGLALLLAVVPRGPALAMPRSEMMIVSPTESVELSPAERGRMRMYLQQNTLACSLGRRAPHGDVRLALDLVNGRPKKVSATTKDAGARAAARCLSGVLKRVVFPSPAPRWQWTGVLRLGGPLIEVDLRDVDGPIEKLPGGELGVSNAIIAALEHPAPCMERYFSSEEAISMVLVAALDTYGGKLIVHEVRESTVVPADLVACVADQVASVTLLVERPITARARIALLRPTTAKDDDAATLIIGGP